MIRVLLIASACIGLAACSQQAEPAREFGIVAEPPAISETSCVVRYRQIDRDSQPVSVVLIPMPRPSDPPARQSMLADRIELCKRLKQGDHFELRELLSPISSAP